MTERAFGVPDVALAVETHVGGVVVAGMDVRTYRCHLYDDIKALNFSTKMSFNDVTIFN